MIFSFQLIIKKVFIFKIIPLFENLIMKIRSLYLAILLLAFIPTFSQIITDRPDQTESAVAIPFGSFQIETGILYSSSFSDPKVKNYLLPTTLLRYSVVKGLELRFVAQYQIVKAGSFTSNGFSDLEIGAKVELLNNDDKNIRIAFLTHLIVPSGSEDFRVDNLGIMNIFAFSHDINENVGIGYNIGYSYFGEGNGDLTYALVVGFGLNDKLSAFVEPYGEWAGFKEFYLNMDAGLTYLLSDNMQLDASFGLGITEQMHFFSFGFSWNIPKK